MSRYPCSNCGEKPPWKLATVMAWWYEENGERCAWRSRLCADCLTLLADSLKAGALADSSLLSACNMCAKDVSTGYRETYLNVYPPKQPPVERVAATCVSCADILRTAFSDRGERLQDRNARAAALADDAEARWNKVEW